MPVRREIPIAVLVLVALAAALVWMRSAAPERPAPPAAPVAVAPSAPAVPPAGTEPSPAAPGREIRTTTRHEPPPEGPLTAKQAKAAAARYRRLARFPKNSRPLEGQDPITVGRAPTMERSAPLGSPGPTLIVFPTDTDYESPGTVTVYAEVVRMEEKEATEQRGEGAPWELRIPAQRIVGEVVRADGVRAGTLLFRDDGREGDAEPGDHFWTATLTPDPDRPDDFRGQFLVHVTAETVEGDELRATTGFSYAVPGARLTGQWREALVDGHLQIEGEVEVEEPGVYQLEGTIAAVADATMIGYARGTATLTPGRAWIPLTFWGLLFRERNVDGPYHLFSVALSTVSENPPRRGDVVPNAYMTQAYAAGDFSDRPFNDPDLLREAERMDQLAQTAPAE